MSTNIATLGIKVESNGVDAATKSLDSLSAAGAKAEGSTEKLSSSLGGLSRVAQAAAAAIAAIKLTEVMTSAIMFAANVEQANVALASIANTMGMTSKAAFGYRDSLRDLNITTNSATNATAQFLKAGLPVESLNQLGTAAQGAAISYKMMTGETISSSEALDKMIRSLVTGNVTELHTLGISVTMREALKENKKLTGEVATEVDSHERKLLMLNDVLAKTAPLMNLYADSTGLASKNLSSAKRPIEEMKLALGNLFLPALTEGSVIFYESVKNGAIWVKNNSETLNDLKSAVTSVYHAIVPATKAVAAYFAVTAGPAAISGMAAWIKSTYSAVAANTALHTQVAAGNAVMLGSAKATAMKAASEAEGAATSYLSARATAVAAEANVAAVLAKRALITAEQNAIQTMMLEAGSTADVTALQNAYTLSTQRAAVAQAELRVAVAGSVAAQEAQAVAAAASADANTVAAVAAGTASTAFLTLGNSLNILMAAFVGWQVGTYLSNEFEIARVAGVALIDSLMTGWIHFKFGVLEVWAGVSGAWNDTIQGMKNTFAGFIEKVANGMDSVKMPEALGGASFVDPATTAGMRELAAGLKSVGDETATTLGKTAALNNEKRAALGVHKQVINSMYEDAEQSKAVITAKKSIADEEKRISEARKVEAAKGVIVDENELAAIKKKYLLVETERKELEKSYKEIHDSRMTAAEKETAYNTAWQATSIYKDEVAAIKEKEAATKKATSAAEKAAKEAKRLADADQDFLDKLLPLNAEQRLYNENLEKLNKLAPALTTEQYEEALKKLKSTLTEEIELEKYRGQIAGKVADYDRQSAQLSMSESEIKIDNINREIYAYEELGQRMVGLNMKSQAVVDANNAAFGKKARADIEAATEAASGMGKMFEDVARNIQSGFAGMFEDIFSGGANTMKKLVESIKSMFVKMLAQMATMAIAKPIMIPMIAAVGSAMGVSNAGIAQAAGTDVGTIGNVVSSGYSLSSAMGSGLNGAKMSAGLMAQKAGWDGAASTIHNMTGEAFAGWSAGIVTFIMGMLNGEEFAKAAAKGVGAGIGAWGGAKAGAAIGSYFPVVGTAIGAVVGAALGAILGSSIMGSLFKEKEDDFGITKQVIGQQGQYSSKGFEPKATVYDPKFNETAEWYHPILSAYSATVATIQDSFNVTLEAFTKELPVEMRDQMMAELASSDMSAILEKASEGEWLAKDAETAITQIATAYAKGLDAKVSEVYSHALGSFVSLKGAAGLLKDSSAWTMLTDQVQAGIESAFKAAAAQISGGDIEGGTAAISSVTDIIAQIGQAMDPISEIIATKNMSEYEKELRSVNKQFDDYRDQLAAAGVDMAKYTDLEEARAIALSKVIDNGIVDTPNNAAKELADVMAQINDIINSAKDNTVTWDSLAAKYDAYRAKLDEVGASFDDYVKMGEAMRIETENLIESIEKIRDAAKAPIEDVIATKEEEIATIGMTSYEKELRAVNKQFDDYAQALRDAGVDLEEYTNLEVARAYVLSKVVNPAIQEAIEAEKALAATRKGVNDPVNEIIVTNGMNEYQVEIRNINKQFDEYKDVLIGAHGSLEELAAVEQARAIKLAGVLKNATEAATAAEQALADIREDGVTKALESERTRTQTNLTAANTAMQGAQSALTKAYAAEQSRLEAHYQTKADSLTAKLDVARDSLSALTSLAGQLKSAISGMKLETLEFAKATRIQAQAQLQSALASAKRGNLEPAKGMDQAFNTLSQDSSDMFADSTAYKADFWKTYNQMAELSKITENSMSSAEQTVNALERTIKANDTWYKAETQLLKDQLDKTLGVDTSVMSVRGATEAFNKAQAAQVAAELAAKEAEEALKKRLDEKAEKELNAQWNKQNEAARDANLKLASIHSASLSAVSAAYSTTAAVNAMTSRMASMMAAIASASRASSSGSFAVGTDYVPQDMLANIHKGERITPAAYNRTDQTNADIVEEVRKLREEMKLQNAEIAKNTKKTAALIDTWDGDGMPDTRS